MIEFIDLKKQQALIKDKIDANIQRVLAHGQYILCLLYTSPSPRD